jgi:hypothetical protein
MSVSNVVYYESINLIFSYGGKKLKYSTGFKACYDDWDFNRQRIKSNKSLLVNAREVNNLLNFIDTSLTKEYSKFISEQIEVTNELLKSYLDKLLNKNTIEITSDKNIDEATAKNIRVKLPSLKSLEATSGASVNTKNTFEGTDFNVKTSSGSEANVSIEYDVVKCESTSGSTLKVNGKALKLTTHSSSGSSINAQGLLVNNVVAESSSGSSTNVHPLVSLKAKASSRSSIDYNSSPKTVSKEESSGGSVSKE